jgi:pyruvate dehydrogenase E2 component (dihydrolipoamide acetyltransferase)
MQISILMPALSPTMEKGNLAKWLKKEGDAVKSGDVIAEIETDKATMEMEAVDEGTLAKILVPEGTSDVPVNQVIAVLATDGKDVKVAALGVGSAPASAAVVPKAKSDLATTAHQPVSAPAAAPKPAALAVQSAKADGKRTRIFSSPLARRLAKQASVDITSIQGSGPHGRVIARDIDAVKQGAVSKPSAPAAVVATPAHVVVPVLGDEKIRALYADGSYEVVPHDNMRKTIAQRLTASNQTIPHFYLTMDCNIGKLLAAREEINAAAPKGQDSKPGYKLSVNDFVIKALALALLRIPDANVSWTETGMLKHKHSDIGVAVAISGGLITPIIRAAETKSLSAISNQMKDLAARARSDKLKPEEYQGGTSSVSNLGMYGIKDFTAVINPPQATILAVGTTEQRAIVKNGGVDTAMIMSVTLSCDHRAVDGALGAELLKVFKTVIENPMMMVV